MTDWNYDLNAVPRSTPVEVLTGDGMIFKAALVRGIYISRAGLKFSQ